MGLASTLGKQKPLLASLFGLVACACADPDAAPEVVWEPVPSDGRYAGLTHAQWAIEWGRWAYAQTDCNFPDLDSDGSRCGAFQDRDGPAFFFAGGAPGTERTRCRVPADKVIVLPLALYMVDNAGVPDAEQLTESEMIEKAAGVLATMTELSLVIDGVEQGELESFAVEPTRFGNELPPEPNRYSCQNMPGVTGQVDPSVITGYFVVMPEPPPGTHELEYGGVTYFGRRAIANKVKTRFTVDAAEE